MIKTGIYDRAMACHKQAVQSGDQGALSQALKHDVEYLEHLSLFVGTAAKSLTNSELRKAQESVNSLKRIKANPDHPGFNATCQALDTALTEVQGQLMDFQILATRLTSAIKSIRRDCESDGEYLAKGIRSLNKVHDEIDQTISGAETLFALDDSLSLYLRKIAELEAGATAMMGAAEST